MRTINKFVVSLAVLGGMGSVASAVQTSAPTKLDFARSCNSVESLSHSSVVCGDASKEVFAKPTEVVTGLLLKFRDLKTGRELSQEVPGLKISFADAKNLNWKNAKPVTKKISTLEKSWKSRPVVEVAQVEFAASAVLYQDPNLQVAAKWQNTKVNRQVASAREKILSVSGVARAQKK